MDKQAKEQLKKSLLEERQTIETELAKFADPNATVPGDYKTRFPRVADPSDTSDERAHDITDYERDKAVEQNLELRLKEINETLTKLEQDEYGLCSNCKSPIETPRIKAIPTVNTCMSCARNASLV